MSRLLDNSASLHALIKGISGNIHTLHGQVNERVAARVSNLVHTSLQATFYLVQAGHAPGVCHIGNVDLEEPAGSR